MRFVKERHSRETGRTLAVQTQHNELRMHSLDAMTIDRVVDGFKHPLTCPIRITISMTEANKVQKDMRAVHPWLIRHSDRHGLDGRATQAALSKLRRVGQQQTSGLKRVTQEQGLEHFLFDGRDESVNKGVELQASFPAWWHCVE